MTHVVVPFFAFRGDEVVENVLAKRVAHQRALFQFVERLAQVRGQFVDAQMAPLAVTHLVDVLVDWRSRVGLLIEPVEARHGGGLEVVGCLRHQQGGEALHVFLLPLKPPPEEADGLELFLPRRLRVVQRLAGRCEQRGEVLQSGLRLGVAVLMLFNLIMSFFTDGGLGLRNGGALAIIFSLVCIGLAAFSFLIDFDAADQAIRAGVPAKYAWQIAFGLTVTLVWLYTEILRLLSYFNSD